MENKEIREEIDMNTTNNDLKEKIIEMRDNLSSATTEIKNLEKKYNELYTIDNQESEEQTEIIDCANKLANSYCAKITSLLQIIDFYNNDEFCKNDTKIITKFLFDLEKTLQKLIRLSAQNYKYDKSKFLDIMKIALKKLITLEEEKDLTNLSEKRAKQITNCIEEYKNMLNFVNSIDSTVNEIKNEEEELEKIKNLEIKNYGQKNNGKWNLIRFGIGAIALTIGIAVGVSSCNNKNNNKNQIPTPTVVDLITPTPKAIPTNVPELTKVPSATLAPELTKAPEINEKIIEKKLEEGMINFDEYKKAFINVSAKYVNDINSAEGVLTAEQAKAALYYYNASRLSSDSEKELVSNDIITNDIKTITAENANGITSLCNKVLTQFCTGNLVTINCADFVINENDKVIVSYIDELATTICNGTKEEALNSYNELIDIINNRHDKIKFSMLSSTSQYQTMYYAVLPANIVAGMREFNLVLYFHQDGTTNKIYANDYIDGMIENLVNPLAMEMGYICPKQKVIK